jgi:hypothetical protein
MRKEETCWKCDARHWSTPVLRESETGRNRTDVQYGAHTLPLSNAEQKEGGWDKVIFEGMERGEESSAREGVHCKCRSESSGEGGEWKRRVREKHSGWYSAPLLCSRVAGSERASGRAGRPGAKREEARGEQTRARRANEQD